MALDKTDEELMHLYQVGNEGAFKELYARHSSMVLGFIKSKIRSAEKAHDIFQEVFVKIHKSKHLYNKTLPFLPWLFTITKNAIVDEVRKSKNEKLHTQMDEISETALVPDQEPNFNQVRPYMESLPENQKSAVYLRYVEEKTFEEISAILKTSPANVRQLVSRGVQRMRELFQNGDTP